MREDQAGKRLVGYVVRGGGGAVTGGELREYVRSRVPEYMAPSAIVELEQMPMTANGKLDRKALPAPESGISEDVILPRDSTELQLFHIWADVLKRANFGIRDNFFDLGGHSLTAVTVSSRVSEIYGERMPVRTIFDFQTIEKMASYLRKEIALVPPSSVIPIQPLGTRLPLFCVHAASGLAQVYIPLAQSLGKEQPLYGLQSYGLEVGQTPISTIEEMAARYLIDVRRIQPVGPYQIGGYSFGGIVAYELAQQLRAAGEEVSLLVMFDAAPRSKHIDNELPTEEELKIQEQRFLVNLIEESGLPVDEIKSLPISDLLQLRLSLNKSERHKELGLNEKQYLQLLRIRVMNPNAASRYRPKPYAGRIVLFRSDTPSDREHDYGWSALAPGGVEVFYLNAEHLGFMSAANAPALAAQLSICLAASRPEPLDRAKPLASQCADAELDFDTGR
jgi:thioesterase domain-containing protein